MFRTTRPRLPPASVQVGAKNSGSYAAAQLRTPAGPLTYESERIRNVNTATPSRRSVSGSPKRVSDLTVVRFARGDRAHAPAHSTRKASIGLILAARRAGR